MTANVSGSLSIKYAPVPSLMAGGIPTSAAAAAAAASVPVNILASTLSGCDRSVVRVVEKVLPPTFREMILVRADDDITEQDGRREGGRISNVNVAAS